MPEQLYTDEETAPFLRSTSRQVRDLRYRGELSFVRVGRLPRIRESDIAEYLERRSVPATTR